MTEYPNIRFRKSEEKYDWFEVTEPCIFTHITGKKYIIQIGYKTDFASIPQWLWWLIPPNGQSANASVVHDYLYDNKIEERVFADLFFYLELKKSVPLWQARLMYVTVRLLAWSWWNK